MRRPVKAAWPTLAMLIVCVVASSALAVQIARNNRAQAQQRFSSLANKTVQQLENRLALYSYGLRGVRGAVIAAGEALDWEAFHAYAASRDIAREFPGARGFGFIRRVARSDEEAFVASVRRDNRPDFAVKQFTPQDTERFVIEYIEPEAPNRTAIGLDIASDATRRNAALAAVRDGDARLTAPLHLIQTPGLARWGFLLLLPIYERDRSTATAEERQQALRGWAYTPLSIDEVMSGFDLFDDSISLALRAFDEVSPPFYQSQSARQPPADGLVQHLALPLYGQTWRVELRARPNFIRSLNLVAPLYVALPVLIGSVWLCVGLYVYLISRQRRKLGLIEHARLAAIVASANDAIVGKSLNGIVTSWNAAAERIFGYSAVEAIGKSLSSLIVPSDQQHEELAILSRIASGEPVPRFTAKRVRKDGSTVEVSVSVSPIVVDGRVVGAAKVVQDVTELQHLQLQLHSALERLEMAVDAAQIGVWVWHLDSNQLSWDDRMCSIYGLPLSLGDDPQLAVLWRSRIHPDDRDMVEQRLHAQLAGTGVYDPVFRIVSAEGAVRHIQAAAIVERDDAGKPSRMVGIDRDVTGQKAAEALIMQLNAGLEDQVAERTAELHQAVSVAESASRSKSDFLANMSHEIRTPMNAILGLSYLLQRNELSPAVRSMVDNISTAGRSLLAIINDILDFSKIEARRLQVERVPFRLAQVLANLGSIIGAANTSKDTELIIAPPPEGCDCLIGDGTRLGQVLINLAGNAVKFTQRGEVVVSTTMLEADDASGSVRLRFSIRDTGIGIPPEKQRSIFEAFTQADSSTVRRFGGTGLGLTISRSLVSLMGGELFLTSEPGVGSEFTFELMFERGGPGEAAVPEMLQQRVLVVDDHELALRTLSETARSLGWDAHAVSSGEIAVEVVTGSQSICYDVVLLDWHMPGIDGLSAAVEIRRQSSAAPTYPIIIMVSSSERELIMSRPESTAIDGILTKPITSSSLYDTVLRAKQNRSQRRTTYSPEQRERLPGVRVLVVDDSELNRKVAVAILTCEGAVTEVACDGLSAVEILRARPRDFDVVLMDVQMPTMDGHAAARSIRADSTLRAIPIIALTAGAFKQQQDDALDAGMIEFVAKPFDVDHLVTVIARVLGRALLAATTPDAAAPRDAVIDFERGLKYWRDASKFRAELDRFAALHAGDARLIALALDAGDAATARAAAHKLAGAAEVVGLTRLAKFARSLEADARGPSELSERVEDLTASLQLSLQTIERDRASERGLLGANSQTDLVSEPANHSERRDRTTQLMAALDTDDPSVIEPLLLIVPSLLPSAQAEQFLARVSAYDFRGAEAILLAEVG